MTTALTGGTVWDGTGASLMPDAVVIWSYPGLVDK
jgi:hypothetical protein